MAQADLELAVLKRVLGELSQLTPFSARRVVRAVRARLGVAEQPDRPARTRKAIALVIETELSDEQIESSPVRVSVYPDPDNEPHGITADAHTARVIADLGEL